MLIDMMFFFFFFNNDKAWCFDKPLKKFEIIILDLNVF